MYVRSTARWRMDFTWILLGLNNEYLAKKTQNDLKCSKSLRIFVSMNISYIICKYMAPLVKETKNLWWPTTYSPVLFFRLIPSLQKKVHRSWFFTLLRRIQLIRITHLAAGQGWSLMQRPPADQRISSPDASLPIARGL